MPDDVVVELSGAEHEPLDGVVVGALVVQDGLEAAARELVEARRGLLEAEKPLRRHEDERPRDDVERLTAEKMEELRGRRAVRDADVLLRAELEEPLEPRARVLGPVALVAVRQEERQP